MAHAAASPRAHAARAAVQTVVDVREEPDVPLRVIAQSRVALPLANALPGKRFENAIALDSLHEDDAIVHARVGEDLLLGLAEQRGCVESLEALKLTLAHHLSLDGELGVGLAQGGLGRNCRSSVGRRAESDAAHDEPERRDGDEGDGARHGNSAERRAGTGTVWTRITARILEKRGVLVQSIGSRLGWHDAHSTFDGRSEARATPRSAAPTAPDEGVKRKQ